MVLAYPAATKPEEENSPQVATLMLQAPALMPFYHKGMDITHNVMEVFVDINAIDNDVKAYITIYKPHWIASDEVATYNIL